MKTLKQHINESLKIGNNLSEWSAYSCQPKTNRKIKEIIGDTRYVHWLSFKKNLYLKH